MIDRLARIEDYQQPVLFGDSDHAVTTGEILFVGRREIVGLLERRQAVVGTSVLASAGALAAEQVNPYRVEAMRYAVGEKQLCILLCKVHHQRLRRFTGDEERSAVLIDEIPSALGNFQR